MAGVVGGNVAGEATRIRASKAFLKEESFLNNTLLGSFYPSPKPFCS